MQKRIVKNDFGIDAKTGRIEQACARYGVGRSTMRNIAKAAVRVENEKRCNPPLKEKELEKAVFPALKRDWQVNSHY